MTICFKYLIINSCVKSQNNYGLKNQTNNMVVNSVLSTQDSNMIKRDITLSQEQSRFNDLHFNVGNDDDSDNQDIHQDLDNQRNFSSKLALLKRAQDLCGTNETLHNQLYTWLENFVISNEINNTDNDNVLQSRSKNEIVTISSNKVTNKRSKSTKRTRPAYEKRKY